MSEFNEEIIPEMLSTHPANETRAKELEELLPIVLFFFKQDLLLSINDFYKASIIFDNINLRHFN